MSPADRERIERLIGAQRTATTLLKDLAGRREEAFLSDPHLQSSAKYNFVAAIEAAIDMASHLISRSLWRAPEDYADTFQVLAEAGVLTESFATELKKMARFRNRLVHMYWEVDTRELRDILVTRLGDFEQFVKDIARWVEQAE